MDFLSPHISSAFETELKLLEDFCKDQKNLNVITAMAKYMALCFQHGSKVLSCGNGGSACDALHFAEELTGQFRQARKALPVIPLMESSHLTCVANDFGFDNIFSRGVEAYGKKGDILVALSTSGNSTNIINAVDKANELGMDTYLFLGKDGGKLKGMGRYEVIVPGLTSDRIQEIHMMCLHIVIEGVERIMFPENY